MGDPSVRKSSLESVKEGLIGDFAGEADIARRQSTQARTHQRLAPVRRCAGYVGCAVTDHAVQDVPHPFIRTGQNQRAVAQQGSQKDLQTAIPAQVIESRPDNLLRVIAPRRDGAGEAFEGVDHQLGRPAGAGREQHPLGRARGGSKSPRRGRWHERDPGYRFGIETGDRGFGNDRVGRGDSDRVSQLGVAQIRRTEHYAPGHAIQFDKAVAAPRGSLARMTTVRPGDFCSPCGGQPSGRRDVRHRHAGLGGVQPGAAWPAQKVVSQ